MRKSRSDPTYARRRKIVGVMGSGSTPHAALARGAGRVIGELGCHILTGAGDGVMAAASEAFREARAPGAAVLGIVRALGDGHLEAASLEAGASGRDYRPNKVNRWVELPVFTHLPESNTTAASRNHINILTSDAIVVLPGGAGTLSEVELAGQYQWVPVILYLGGERVGGFSAEELRRAKAPAARIVRGDEALKEVLSEVLGLLRQH